MQRLSNLDASFLRLERADAPMHVGGTLIFAAPADGPMTFARLQAHVASRLQTARVFRERLYLPSTPLENPVWVSDRPVVLDQHLRHATVPGPLDLAALAPLREAFFSEVLPRDRPLWDLLYVEEAPTSARGKQKAGSGRFALLVKIHHAAVDGVSAEAVLMGLLDNSPVPRALPPDNWQPEQPPAPSSLPRSIGAATRGAPWRDIAGTAGMLGKRFLKRAVSAQERLLPFHFQAPRTPFNTAIGARRVFPAAHLPMRQLLQVRHAHQDSKLNDVVLAVCGGALQRYLAARGELPDKSLVAMAPISKRAPDQKHRQGNQVSSMLVNLATDIDSPLLRLARISLGTQVAKAYNREMPVETLFDSLPSTSPALFLGAWSRFGLSRHLPPLFNVIVTNVPASPVPLYLDGAPMLSLTGMAGIYDGLGLVMVVTSYTDTLSIGITSAPEVLADPEHFVECLHEALAELVAVSPAATPAPGSTRTTTATAVA